MLACICGLAWLDLSSLEDLDGLALGDLHDRLRPALACALDRAAPLRLRLDLEHVHRQDFDAELLLDGLADLRAVRVGVHLERVLALLDRPIALLGHDRGDDHVVDVDAHEASLLFRPARLSMSGSAVSVTSSARAQTTEATSSSLGVTMTTLGRLRKDLMNASSS